MTWEPVGNSWLAELGRDAGYDEGITPLLMDLLGPIRGERYLDAGCGDGRMMCHLHESGAIGAGIDSVPEFLRRAASWGPFGASSPVSRVAPVGAWADVCGVARPGAHR